MSEARRIILARHAETGDQYRGCYVGASDVPISEYGHKQSEDLAVRLEAARPVSCLISPKLRTRQTAAPVARRLALTPEVDEGLREVDFGAWEGLSFAEIAARYPAEVENWAGLGSDFCFPAGERVADFLSRVHGAGDTLLARARKGPVLGISHGGVIRALLCHFLGLAPEQYLLFGVEPARYAVLDVYDQGAVLQGFNI